MLRNWITNLQTSRTYQLPPKWMEGSLSRLCPMPNGSLEGTPCTHSLRPSTVLNTFMRTSLLGGGTPPSFLFSTTIFFFSWFWRCKASLVGGERARCSVTDCLSVRVSPASYAVSTSSCWDKWRWLLRSEHSWRKKIKLEFKSTGWSVNIKLSFITYRFSSSSKHPNWLWGPPSLLFIGY
jgi:hypothetical protein